MKWIVFVITIIHCLIHLLGFVKAFDLKDLKEISTNVSRPMGLLWLFDAILFLTFGIMYFSNATYTWILGIIAVLISQFLIFNIWKDAKFGTLPNVLIFTVSFFLFSNWSFQRVIKQETTSIFNQVEIKNDNIVTETDIEHLAAPVQNWLRNSGTVGKPYIHTGKVLQKAELKLKPEQNDWLQATALQYTIIDKPAFIWTVDVKMNHLLNFVGRDKYENGKGEMLIKINSLLKVVDECGEKLNEGTLQRFLGEMVWFPSLALSEHILWEAINDSTAKATMNYMGTSGSGTFTFNAAGDVTQFSALRYYGNTTDAKRYLWIMNINAYNFFEGIKVPTRMAATWKFDEGDWTWLRLEVTEIQYNENIDKI